MVCVIQVDIPIYKFGDVVQVLEDIVEVQKLQKGHGGWNDDITMVNQQKKKSVGMCVLGLCN